MARVEERQAFPTSSTTYSPMREDQGEASHVFNMEDEVVSPSWCCCFHFGGGGRKSNQESRSLLRENDIDGGDYLHQESWLVNHLKKLKGFSELVAGPKWKNFIRKIGKYCKPKKFSKTDQYMYSPNSYALNFDNTRLEGDEDDLFVSFSSRFSAPPSSTDKQRPAAATSS